MKRRASFEGILRRWSFRGQREAWYVCLCMCVNGGEGKCRRWMQLLGKKGRFGVYK